MRGVRGVVAVLRRVVGDSCGVDGGRMRVGAADYFGDQLCAEGRDAGHAPVARGVRGEGG